MGRNGRRPMLDGYSGVSAVQFVGYLGAPCSVAAVFLTVSAGRCSVSEDP